MNKILFIDDDFHASDYISEIFNDEGYELLHARSPLEAMEFAEKFNSEISILILDLMMPPSELPDFEETSDGLKTGLVLYRKYLKKLIPKVPVIVVSGIRSISILDEVKNEKRVCAILRKPSSVFELLEIIKDNIPNKSLNIDSGNSPAAS